MYTCESIDTIQTLPAGSRPREKLKSLGAKNLTDSELLVNMIGSGNRIHGVATVAAKLLTLYDGSRDEPTVHDLLKISGVGGARASMIIAAMEFARRRLGIHAKTITAPADVFPLISHFGDRTQEIFLSLSLNGAHELITIRTVSIGLVNRTIVHPREVFSDPITDRAAAVIVAHNHPSGKLVPSEEDVDVTNQLQRAGEILGIRLLDHVIFSSSAYYSFLEDNRL